ncbi:nucleotidyltransferase family protein [Polaromonas sp.]|uniref:nucleotidyltransferase family protein n=1 Tax=Polaromonas sp. TaxID=1869339 RepID=UPI003265CB90
MDAARPGAGLPTVLVLASGRSERFTASGGSTHKLQALLAGKSVLQHTLDAVIASGLAWHLEQAGHPGMGDSIAAAVRATRDARGWLVLPGDLPLVRSDTLRAVAQALAQHAVAIPLYQGARGHPVGFSAVCREALLDLKGNQGAAPVVRSHLAMNSVAFMELDDIGTVTDIDTVEDLARAEELLTMR